MFQNFEDFGEFVEDIEADEADEFFYEADEAAARRRPTPPRPGRIPTAKRGNPVPQKVAAGYATKAELQATAQRLDGRIAINSKAITGVDGRVRGVEAETGKMKVVLAREVRERKAATEALKKSLDEQRQLSMLLPLLSTQETTTIGDVENVVIDSGDSLSRVLPILLMSGGLGGSAGGGGGGGAGGPFGGGSDGGIGTLALVLALAPKK